MDDGSASGMSGPPGGWVAWGVGVVAAALLWHLCRRGRRAALAKKAAELAAHPPPQGWTIDAMRPEEYNAAVDIAVAAFCQDNPLIVHTQMPPDIYRQLVLQDISRASAVETGLSLVARDAQGAPQAFLFLQPTDFTHQPHESLWDLHPGLRVMYEMVAGVYDRALWPPGKIGLMSMCSVSTAACSRWRLRSHTDDAVLQGKTLHAAMGGTFPGCDGKGLGKALRTRAVEVARERGFNTLLVEPGHGATRHIWTKHCDGQIRGEISADEFVSKSKVLGERPMAGVESQPGVVATVSLCEVVIRDSIWDRGVFWPAAFVRLMLQDREAKKQPAPSSV